MILKLRHIYPQAKESIRDDDASVICVSGLALHSAIEYRKRELLPKFQNEHTNETSQKFTDELELLKCMMTTDTSFVPHVISFQNRGNMTFMYPAMLDFGRALFSTVRSSLNYSSYMKSGSELFKQTTEHTLESTELDLDPMRKPCSL